MADNAMLDLGCESIGMNEIVAIGVGNQSTTIVAKKLREKFPKESIQEIDDNIQLWYDSIVDEELKVSTKMAAKKLFDLGFGRSEMRMKKGRASPLAQHGVV